jgi:hypothetical protein
MAKKAHFDQSGRCSTIESRALDIISFWDFSKRRVPMIPLDTYSPSYWLLADDQLDLGLDRAKADLFRAHFNHSLLFNPSLLFSDSMAINNRNFRHLVEHDSEFRTLIENSHFGIAVRTDANNQALDLIELKERFIKDRKSRVTELDHSNDGLQFLQNCSEIVPYSGQELAQFYSEQVVEGQI